MGRYTLEATVAPAVFVDVREVGGERLDMQSGGNSKAPRKIWKATQTFQFRKLLRRWAKVWETVALAEQAQIEWSSRLTCTLGRAYPQRMLIRLNTQLRGPQHATILKEVLCHESAHLAMHILYGRDATKHGSEWKRLVEMAGYAPRTGIHVPELVSRRALSIRYEHTCPICHAKRFAKRRQPTWRCVACRQLGLDGKLVIHRRSATSEVRDER